MEVQLTESANHAFRNYLKNAESEEFVLGLIKGNWSDEATELWHLSLYKRDHAELVAQEVREAGFEAFYRVDGLDLFIPQYQLLGELEGHTIDIDDGHIVVT